MALTLRPISLRQANAFVAKYHRHHKPARGCLFCLSACVDDQTVGVAIISRPVSRHLTDGVTCEIVRLCTTGERNVCSFLLGRARRAAQAIGYAKIITYTLPEEGGASLRAAGYAEVGRTKGGAWARADRPRADAHPICAKIRWEACSNTALSTETRPA